MTPKNQNKTAKHLGASFNRKAQKYESRARLINPQTGKSTKLFLGYYDTSRAAGNMYAAAHMNKDKYTGDAKAFREILNTILTVI